LKIFFNNSGTNKKEEFIPIDESNIKLYVCGPTVYDRAHLGNARSSVAFDVLFRVLKSSYENVTYVRNITDVDDKILNKSNDTGLSINSITNQMINFFHKDLEYLSCLKPTYEPRATETISEMIEMIKKLIERSHAYISNGHVYFDVKSFQNYGELSNRNIEKLNSGARIEVSEYKKDPLDFVLWKPAKSHEKMSFESPWGNGRPGWHIECSAMSKKYLGDEFDIHGGGADLIFPHHENEVAQSKCESENNKFAKYWIHNGFLTINGEKMSKSAGNFTTVNDLVEKDIDGSVLRYFYLTTHYRKPLDYNQKALNDAKKSIEKFRNTLQKSKIANVKVPKEFLVYLYDDLNTPLALSYLHKLSDDNKVDELIACCDFLGLKINMKDECGIDNNIKILAEERMALKEKKLWEESDKKRQEISDLGYDILDTKEGYKILKKSPM
jgi:cysteinyl-tRNA synthetase